MTRRNPTETVPALQEPSRARRGRPPRTPASDAPDASPLAALPDDVSALPALTAPASPMNDGAVTLADIALACGVHKSTVHRALAGADERGQMNHSTAVRVRAMAARMNYDPSRNEGARRLSLRKQGKVVVNRLVALFFPTDFPQMSYFLRLFNGVLGGLREQGFDLLATTVDGDDIVLPSAIARGDVDACIVFAQADTIRTLQEMLLATSGFGERPMLSLLRPGPNLLSVTAHERAGAGAAMEHLLDLGHRRVLHFYADSAHNYYASERLNGCVDAVRKFGLAPEEVLCGSELDFQVPMGQYLSVPLRAALAQWPDCTALLLPNDGFAGEAKRCLSQLGFEIPRDMSVVGFDDDTPMLDSAGANMLTTVAMPLEEVGRAAARLLVARVTGQPAPDSQDLPTQLVVRASTAPPHV